MNDLNTNTRLYPRRAIVVYHDNAKTNYYLEDREIKNVKGKSVFMAASPMKDEVMKSIARSYVKSTGSKMSFDGIIPEHLLYCQNKEGQTIVMWYRPAIKQLLNFSAHLQIKGDTYVNIPATLYLVKNNKLYCYALGSNDRPNLKTKIFNAPFFNIYADGNVCLGTANIGKKAKTFEDEAMRFERGFYAAEQNGGNYQDSCKTDLKILWSKLVKSKTVFPLDQLIQHKDYPTLGDLTDKLIGKSKNDYDDED